MLFKQYQFKELNAISKKLKERFPNEEVLNIIPERLADSEYYLGVRELHKLLHLIYLYIVKKETK